MRRPPKSRAPPGAQNRGLVAGPTGESKRTGGFYGDSMGRGNALSYGTMAERRIAIVYDYMTQMGGGERVIRELHSVFPDAPIFTVVYDPKALPPDFRTMDIRTSFLDRLPLAHRKFELYIPFYGFAMEQFDLRAYDVVLRDRKSVV